MIIIIIINLEQELGSPDHRQSGTKRNTCETLPDPVNTKVLKGKSGKLEKTSRKSAVLLTYSGPMDRGIIPGES